MSFAFCSYFRGRMKRLFARQINFTRQNGNLTFVPHHEAVIESQLEKLQMLVDSSTNILILTGAGVSTESGIPDYRSEVVGLYARSNHRPIQHQDFMRSKHVRQRYWARNFVGWSKFSTVQPNASHFVLASWERHGKISSIVTQNVDRLHHKAGSKATVELHGCAHEVKCMKCNYEMSRDEFQRILTELNPSLSVPNAAIRPDADVELSQEIINTFRVPNCQQCRDELEGFYKPNIVFFGDNVPKSRVEFVFSQLQSSDCLLVLGSSLYVYSGYRFILRASELGIPSAIVNIGPTRGDKYASIKLSAKCSEVLTKICI
ncbi:hypothetical protein GHT06_020881 [Daphnia sinensis]|uniref:NAD-dependent protein deacylase n=1 Tax=Daphnia sinensis TaxID=1820382 RepID=A0AAD5KIG2_9CRUS|nr:hypothetical protein GHT06_020881 [Daphnia sinensis]